MNRVPRESRRPGEMIFGDGCLGRVGLTCRRLASLLGVTGGGAIGAFCSGRAAEGRSLLFSLGSSSSCFLGGAGLGGCVVAGAGLFGGVTTAG